ncbi:MAG: hypothetical protein GYB67_11290 [Chloroflexi bacterium]|nr:hypothetical protein [Chloroflexota bacterium]
MPGLSGSTPFAFAHRDDLHTLPAAARDHEVNLHGGFAVDQRDGFGPIYYGMPGAGIVRIDADLRQQTLIPLPDRLQPLNFHSTKLGQIDGAWRLFLPANDAELVAVIDLDGALDFVLSRPEFAQYQAEQDGDPVPFKPTDTALVGADLYVADGYGANYITRADARSQAWTGIFGGKNTDAAENGTFGTAHGIRQTHDQQHLIIADRWHSRLQVHDFDGGFVASHGVPAGAWPCGVDFIEWEGRWLAVVGCLYAADRNRPAPIFVLDAVTFEILSTIRPKEDLGVELAQHLHNVVWYAQGDNLYLVCQSWKPGFYFVLERAG